MAKIAVTGIMTREEAKAKRGVTQAGVTSKTHGGVTIVTAITAITPEVTAKTTTGIKRT